MLYLINFFQLGCLAIIILSLLKLNTAIKAKKVNVLIVMQGLIIGVLLLIFSLFLIFLYQHGLIDLSAIDFTRTIEILFFKGIFSISFFTVLTPYLLYLILSKKNRFSLSILVSVIIGGIFSFIFYFKEFIL